MEPYLTAGGEGRATFYLGDCVELMRQIPEKSIDVVVTSPPYNLGIKYDTFDDTADRRSYLEWSIGWLDAVQRVLTDTGSLFLNVGSSPKDPWIADDVAMCARAIFKLQNHIHWIKAISLPDRSHGHFKPINSKRFVNDTHEHVYHFTKTGSVMIDRLALGVPYEDSTNLKRWKAANGKRCRGNVWYIPYETIRSRRLDRPHPATFPVQLPLNCLRLHGANTIKTVLDPFCGLGSTAVACAQLGVKCIGMDVDAGYLHDAALRVQDAITTIV